MPRHTKRNAGKPLRLHDSDPNEGTNPGRSGQCEPNSETLNQDDNTTLLDCVQALETLLAQTADNKANCTTPRTKKRLPSSSSSSDSETRVRRSRSKTYKNRKSCKHNKSAKRSRSSISSSDSSSDHKYSDSTDSTDSSPTPHARPIVSFGTCFGNSVKDKIKKKIIQHKYIDLGLLLPTEHAINTSDSEIQELLSYSHNIRLMAKQHYNWHQYDETFRRERETSLCSWVTETWPSPTVSPSNPTNIQTPHWK